VQGVEEVGEGTPPGPVLGQVVDLPAPGVRQADGDGDEVGADGGGGGMGVEGRGQAPGGAGEVVGDGGQHQPGGVGGEAAGGQVRQRGALQISDDLLDDGVAVVVGLGLDQGEG
jgi:hypothetical protein